MQKLARNRESSRKEIVVSSNLTVVHKKQDPPQNQNLNEKYKSWVMPPETQRYIKHKKHDPL